MLNIINILSDLTGKNLQPIYKETRPGDIRYSLADHTALKAPG